MLKLETIVGALKNPINALNYFANSTREYKLKRIDDNFYTEGIVTRKEITISTRTTADNNLMIKTNAKVRYLVEIKTKGINFIVNNKSMYDKLNERDKVGVIYQGVDIKITDYEPPNFKQRVSINGPRWIPRRIEKLNYYLIYE